MSTLVWFRGKDVRLSDHAALSAAAEQGQFVPLFVIDPYFFAEERARRSPHRIQFLLESLRSLEANLAARGSRLLVVAGKSVDVVPHIARALGVGRVVAQRWSEPFGRERDARIAKALGVPFVLHEGELLAPPGAVRSASGTPYAVFTPFARAFVEQAVIGRPLSVSRALPPVPKLPAAVEAMRVSIPECEALGLTPNPSLQRGGEREARARLKHFITEVASRYEKTRDRVDIQGSSRLSADLHFGTLSVRTVWQAVEDALGPCEAARVFHNELLWREFAHTALHDRPELLQRPFRADFEGFPYREDGPAWEGWVDGRTGYPIVDASARQLVAEGFVPNRARMISASFLTKHLLIDYRRGEAHYLKWLTDGDWANNNLGWQWSAGCGVDAQPYFRVFNPVLQGKKFDPEGAYVRRFVPELARLPTRFIHQPWLAPSEVLRATGVRLGADYPRPIVDHAEARARFLALATEHLQRRG